MREGEGEEGEGEEGEEGEREEGEERDEGGKISRKSMEVCISNLLKTSKIPVESAF